MTHNSPSSALTDQQIMEGLAVKVMGWENDGGHDFDHPENGRWICRKCGYSIRSHALPMYNNGKCDGWNSKGNFRPLTEWNDTWKVIEAMKARKCCILLEWQKVVDWNVAILPNHVMAGLLSKNNGKVPEEAYMHEGDNGVQKTICLAALSALDFTISE